jgi:xylan 1,4-beta-xylosidase
MKALSYWVVSDHFEELGRPPTLFHDGFGLLTLGNLRKPRYWALHLAAHMGDQVLPVEISGDGADVLVRAWATRHHDGTVDVLVWSNTINSQVMHGDERLVRDVTVTIDGLESATYGVRIARVDEEHSNIKAAWSGVDWPDQHEWDRLREADQLYTDEVDDLVPTTGTGSVSVTLPQPGVVRIRLTADGQPSAQDEEITR